MADNYPLVQLLVGLLLGTAHTAFVAGLLWLHPAVFAAYSVINIVAALRVQGTDRTAGVLVMVSHGWAVLALPTHQAIAAGGLCSCLLVLVLGGPKARGSP